VVELKGGIKLARGGCEDYPGIRGRTDRRPAITSSNSPVDSHNHRKFSHKLSCDLKKAKCLYENRILNSNNKSVYKYIRQKMSSTVSTPRVQKSDGSLSESDLETANILSKFFESVFVKEPPSLPHTIHRPYVHDSLETVILNENLLLEEMYRINVNSAPGPDNITAKTLKFCAGALVQSLLHIFKLSFHLRLYLQGG
jgi:hypothetical protein